MAAPGDGANGGGDDTGRGRTGRRATREGRRSRLHAKHEAGAASVSGSSGSAGGSSSQNAAAAAAAAAAAGSQSTAAGSAASAVQQPTLSAGGGTLSDLLKLTPQEYLDRFSVTAYLKDVTTLLLENRPSCPVAFIADYFKNVIQGTSPLVRSYRYIRLTALTRLSFWDNLVAAYATLDDRKGGGVGVTGADMRRLVHLLCVDFPPEIINAVLEVYDKTETCVIPFRHFSSGVYACLMYEQFFAAVERLFIELDTEKKGYVAVAKLRDSLYAAVAAHKTRVWPSAAELGPPGRYVESIYASDVPSRDDITRFIRSIDAPHVTFKQFMKKIFALTDPVDAPPVADSIAVAAATSDNASCTRTHNGVAAAAATAAGGPAKSSSIRMPSASPLVSGMGGSTGTTVVSNAANEVRPPSAAAAAGAKDG